jgi:spore germination cell wall hydrolase CwlJ-like protein
MGTLIALPAPTAPRLRTAAIALLIASFATLVGAVMVGGRMSRQELVVPVPTLSATVISPEQRALVEATSGERAALHSEGASARVANAALPFSTAPILRAPAFSLGATPAAINGSALLCLTQAIYYEAGFEPEAGKRAVAQVVLNRVRHPAFAHSVCGVVYEGAPARGCQFSFACDGALARRPAADAWQKAHAVALWALAGGTDPDVGMATHYHTDWISPYWAPKLAKIRQIGAHIFYRWPGGWGEPRAFASRYSGVERLWAPATIAGQVQAPMSIDPEAGIVDRRAPLR